MEANAKVLSGIFERGSLSLFLERFWSQKHK